MTNLAFWLCQFDLFILLKLFRLVTCTEMPHKWTFFHWHSERMFNILATQMKARRHQKTLYNIYLDLCHHHHESNPFSVSFLHRKDYLNLQKLIKKKFSLNLIWWNIENSFKTFSRIFFKDTHKLLTLILYLNFIHWNINKEI